MLAEYREARACRSVERTWREFKDQRSFNGIAHLPYLTSGKPLSSAIRFSSSEGSRPRGKQKSSVPLRVSCCKNESNCSLVSQRLLPSEVSYKSFVGIHGEGCPMPISNLSIAELQRTYLVLSNFARSAFVSRAAAFLVSKISSALPRHIIVRLEPSCSG